MIAEACDRCRCSEHRPVTHRRRLTERRRTEDRRSTDLLGRLRGAGLGLPAARRPGACGDARGRPDRHRVRPGRLPARRPAARRPAAHACGRVGRLRPRGPARARPRPVPGSSDLDGFVAAGADVVVLAAATGLDGYDLRPDPGRRRLADAAGQPRPAAARRPRTAASPPSLHPHVGTMVEQTAEVQRVLDGSGIGLCLDTGHLLIGGTDPVDAGRAGRRPDRPRARQGRRRQHAPPRCGPGTRTYTEAVAAGHVPAARRRRRGLRRDRRGAGAGTATTAGTSWSRTPSWPAAEPTGEGPVADVRTSFYYLLALAAQHSGVGI